MTRKKKWAKRIVLGTMWAISIYVHWPRAKQVNVTITYEIPEEAEEAFDSGTDAEDFSKAAQMLADIDEVDPLRALLADEDRAVELIADAISNPGQYVSEVFVSEWPGRAVLAALREVAGIGG